MDKNCFGFIKFNARKWLEKFAYGELSFSCAARFISDYQCTGNESRGDRLEAVFAHLPNTDKRIDEYKTQFGTDLEIINDGNMVYLRRRSSCLVPIFCLFSITDSLLNAKEIDKNRVQFSFDFPEEMYSGFSDNDGMCSAYVQAKTFEDEIDCTMRMLSLKTEKKLVTYLDKEIEEYCFEPTDERNELFYKSKSYRGQNEYRIILPSIQFCSASDRKNIQLCNVNPNDRHVFDTRVGMSFIGLR